MLLTPWGRVSCISKTTCFLVNCISLFPPVWMEQGAKTAQSCLVHRSLIIANRTPSAMMNRAQFGMQGLSQSEAFPPLSPFCSDIDGECDVTLHIKVSACIRSRHLVTRRSPRDFVTLRSEVGAGNQLLFQAVAD